MRTYLADIIPKIQRYSKKLEDLTKLSNQHWVSFGDMSDSKRVFIFRSNNELLIFENGIRVDKGIWEYLGNQSLHIETSQGGYLLKHGFFDENLIALKVDSTDNYAFFINESKYQSELNTIDDILIFLERTYLGSQPPKNYSSPNDEKFPPEYRESEPVEDWDLTKGKHYLIQIIFENRTSHNIYQSFNTKKYFYMHSTNGITVCENKEDCVKQLYLHIIHRI